MYETCVGQKEKEKKKDESTPCVLCAMFATPALGALDESAAQVSADHIAQQLRHPERGSTR